ncbi:MAG: hypothetical protein HQL86_09130 [Magnetococcales bacterium]|nr:hypothetical protein [Magnetococcales bacterium]
MLIFKHRKTGTIYRLLAHGIDETSVRAGLGVVVYCPLDTEHTVYVREEREFEMMFEMLGPEEMDRLGV